MPMQLYNRIDIYDVKDRMWREAHVVEINKDQIKIHYRGFTDKYDEWLNITKDLARIKEVGSLSGAEGQAKYNLRLQ